MQDLFSTHQYTIPVEKLGVPINLVPIGDVHWGSPNCAKDKFRRFIAETSELKNPHYLFLGDTHDLASTTEKEHIAKLHESTQYQLDAWAEEQCDEFLDILGPSVVGRTIGLIEGNHHHRFTDGSTSTNYMARKLKTKYLGGASLIRLRFKDGTSIATVDILAYHGRGGGRTVGAPFNTLEKDYNAFDVQMVISGHDHKKGVLPAPPRVGLTKGRGKLGLQSRNGLLVKSGTFLQSYDAGKRSYAVRHMYPPVALGGVVIQMTPKRERGKNGRGFFVEMKGVG